MLASEVLRRAFRQPRAATTATVELGSNVHGQFGTAGAWRAGAEASIRDWINENPEPIDGCLEALLSHTGLAGSRPELRGFVQGPLLDRVGELAHAAAPDSDLSQALAEGGVLPMFGFPTRVRYLFHGRPKAYPWPPEATVGRDLEIAIGQFAPGSETPKDKAIHIAVGVAGWDSVGGRVRYDQNPLGPREKVHLLPLLPLPRAS